MAFEKDIDQIKELEKEISNTKYNKRTQHAIGLMKAKLAKLKDKQEQRVAKSGGSGEGYSVRKTGDGTVILLGYPSAGKSTLLNSLTDANSEVGAYAFTTLTVVPGVMEYKHAKIQILDVPGIVHGAASGRGRGKEVLSTMRNADLCLIVLDGTQPSQLPSIKKEIYETGIRFSKKPDVKIRKTAKDGIRIGRTVQTPELDDVTVKGILKEFRINNAEVLIRTPISADEFIDCVEDNKKYMSVVLVVNKADMLSEEQKKKMKKNLKPDLFISAQKKIGLNELREFIFDRLDLIRLYLKEPSKPADMDEPLIAFKNSTIEKICIKLHRDFKDKFKFARIWGKSAKFDGQKVSLPHVLQDQDVLELHMR
ncbi:GTP-binding protein [Candidatus Woesearchaeota archaeon]|nr:MAG: GTP-binding protein [Candidatus Woesearchaeota archaeon]